MASAAEVRAFRDQTSDVVALAYGDILAYWDSVDMSDGKAAIRSLEAFLPGVIREYGEVGAAAAAEFYDDLRAQSPKARRAYRAILGDAVPIEQIAGSTRWAAVPLIEGQGPEQTLGRVLSLTDRLVKAPVRGTIRENTLRDPSDARYARVPRGSACAFCLTMASRGAVYASEAAASDNYHDKCGCTPTPVWDTDTDYPEGYRPEELQRAYASAKDAADASGSLTGADGILAELRRREGVR